MRPWPLRCTPIFFGGETSRIVACFGISFSVKINGAANESELVVQPYCSSHPLSWAVLHPRELLGIGTYAAARCPQVVAPSSSSSGGMTNVASL